MFKDSEQLHSHGEQPVLEAARRGTTWPSIELLGSKSHVKSHVKTDGSSRKSRLRRYRFHKRSGPNTEVALDLLPQTHPDLRTPAGVTIKEEFEDEYNAAGIVSSDTNATQPIHVSSRSLELVENSFLEMVDHVKHERWRCLPEIGSSETDSELSRSEGCSVGDDDDIFRTLPNKLLTQIFSNEDFYDLGDRTQSSEKDMKGRRIVRPVESGKSSRLAQVSSQAPITNGRKRKCLSSGDGNDEEDEDNIRDTKKEKQQTTWPPQLCPVFVANPSHVDFRPGGRLSLCAKHISKIPQHMKRYHIRPEQCDNCGFRGDAGQVKDHKLTSCPRVPFDLVPPEDKEKENLLKQKRGSPWREVFKIQMGSDVSNYLEAKKYIACREASSDFSRSFANYLKPKWESIIKGYYESSDYQMFSEQHPGVNFGPNDPSRPRSKIENIFVEEFLYPGRPPRWFETPITTPLVPPTTKTIVAPVVVADDYPTPLSPNSPKKGGTSPSSQVRPSSPQTDEMPKAISQPSASVWDVKVQSDHLAAKDLSLGSCLHSPQTYEASENIEPPPVARQTSAEHLISFSHRRITTSNISSTLLKNNSSQSAQHLAKSSSRISSQEPTQCNIPRSDMPVTTAIGPYTSDTSRRASSTCTAHETFTQAYVNPNHMDSYPLNDQAQPELSEFHYQQNNLLVPPSQSSILPPDFNYNSSIPSESCFKNLAAPQPVEYEQSVVSCLYCVLGAPDGRSVSFNGHAGKWHSHQDDAQLSSLSGPIGAVGLQGGICKYTDGDILTSMTSSNPVGSHRPVAGFGSRLNGNTGILPDLATGCAANGIQYLYNNGDHETVAKGQANTIEANIWEDWTDGAGDIA
ncbi:hypothetical protein DFP73DRAFT_595141 [Morchella snyderi]|nr:hypothetical protein DFP73DRAFT_595141 [Morchella snyderi]